MTFGPALGFGVTIAAIGVALQVGLLVVLGAALPIYYFGKDMMDDGE